MSSGGKRQGAGRRRGAVNRLTAMAKDTIARVAGKGITPLEFMLNVMRDETQTFADRFDAAKSAAPYVHPRLAAVDHTADQNTQFAIAIVTGVPRHEDDIIETGANVVSSDSTATAH